MDDIKIDGKCINKSNTKVIRAYIFFGHSIID